MNPATAADTSAFTIQVFSSWDDDLNDGVTKLAETSTPFIPESAYVHVGGVISDASITTSDNYVGSFENNVATITFTPASSLQ